MAIPWKTAPVLTDAGMMLRALYRLPGYLRHPLTLPECRTILRQRLEQRESNWLDLVRRAIWTNAASPYRPLLHQAGCEPGDLERLARQDGLEGALQALLRAGVYLTVDEFKGRRPAVRGSAAIAVDHRQLRNPLSVPTLWAATSGSGGAATRIQFGMACVRDHAVNMALTLAARGGAGWRSAVWVARGLIPVLWYSALGGPPARWFMQADPRTCGLRSQLWWSIRMITTTSWLAGRPIHFPEHVPVDAPLPIARWIDSTLRAGEVPHLWTAPSAAVRLCRAAEEAGIGLAGARLTLTGEPITPARLAAICRAQVDALPDYGTVDSGGSMTGGCLSPAAPDDVHLFSDLNALIQGAGPPFPPRALFVSSLRPTTPFILLNVSMGDSATMAERRCGCPLEALGWRTHLHTIRSYEKLTAGGVTFEDSEIVPLLEDLLPRSFGGGPADYQLVEDEDGEGRPQLCLLIDPAAGPIDPAAVAEAFLDAIGRSSEGKRCMADQWRQAGLPRVERRSPQPTASGKILHLVAAHTTLGGASATPGGPP